MSIQGEDDERTRDTSDTLRGQAYQLLSSEWLTTCIRLLIALNVLIYIIASCPDLMSSNLQFVFDVVTFSSKVLFTLEYFIRFWCIVDSEAYSAYNSTWVARFWWALSFFALVDLIALAPAWVDWAVDVDPFGESTLWIRLLRLLLVLQGGENTDAMAIYASVWHANKSMFKTTLFCGIVTWIVCSTLMYYAERGDDSAQDEAYDIKQSERFESVPNAAWYTLILLSGDYPIIGFTFFGKCINFCMMFIAVGVVGIPTGILATGFQKAIEKQAKIIAKRDGVDQEDANEEGDKKQVDADSDDDNNEEKKKSANGRTSPGYSTFAEDGNVDLPPIDFHPSDARFAVYRFFHHPERSGTAAVAFKYFVFALILTGSTMWAISTMEHEKDTFSQYSLDVVEVISVIVFTIEYILRVWSVVDEEDKTLQYNDNLKGRWNYCTSFLALVDLSAILPFYIDWLLFPGVEFFPSTFMRIFRLVHVFTDYKYTRAFELFDDTFVQNKQILITTGFAAFVTWIFCATMLYFTDSENEALEGRFASIPRSMWYTAVMLTGEFPQNDFTNWGKLVATFVAVVAVAIFGVPTGIIGASFLALYAGEDDDDDDDDEDEDEDENAEKELTAEELAKFETNKTKRCLKCRIIYADQRGPRAQTHLFMCADTTWGHRFELFIFALIFVNVATFILSTVESLAHAQSIDDVFYYIEVFSVLVFTLEYVLRVWAVVEEEAYADPVWGRLRYMGSFFGVVDLLAIVPFYVGLAINGWGENASDDGYSTTFVRVFRLLRILKAEKYMESLTLLDDVVRTNKEVIAVTGFVSMLMWVVMSVLFYLAQKDLKWGDTLFDGKEEYFKDIPSAMWPTLLMLSSEFPLADFSVLGAFLGLIMILFAIGLFGNFIGIIADGFESVFGERAALKKEAKCIQVDT